MQQLAWRQSQHTHSFHQPLGLVILEVGMAKHNTCHFGARATHVPLGKDVVQCVATWSSFCGLLLNCSPTRQNYHELPNVDHFWHREPALSWQFNHPQHHSPSWLIIHHAWNQAPILCVREHPSRTLPSLFDSPCCSHAPPVHSEESTLGGSWSTVMSSEQYYRETITTMVDSQDILLCWRFNYINQPHS